MIVKLLTDHHLEFLSLKGGYTCSSESAHVKMPHCWKSHATAQMHFGSDRICAKTPLNALADVSNGSWCVYIWHTVKPVLSGHSKRRPKLVFKTDYRLMQVKSIAGQKYCRMLQGAHSAMLSTFIN